MNLPAILADAGLISAQATVSTNSVVTNVDGSVTITLAPTVTVHSINLTPWFICIIIAIIVGAFIIFFRKSDSN
jgi:hypothetical protein